MHSSRSIFLSFLVTGSCILFSANVAGASEQDSTFGTACIFYNSLNQIHNNTAEDSLEFEPRGPAASFIHDKDSVPANATKFNLNTATGTLRNQTTSLSAFSICFWGKEFLRWGYVVTIGNGPNKPGALQITTGFSNEIEIYSIGPIKEYYPNTIPLDSTKKWNPRWTHFTVSRDSTGKGELIINGTSRIPIDIDPISGSQVILGDPNYYGSRQFTGCLDELYVFNRTLTTDELKQLAKSSIASIHQSEFRFLPTSITSEKSAVFDLMGKRFTAITGASKSSGVVIRIYNTGKEQKLFTECFFGELPGVMIVKYNSIQLRVF